MKISAYLLVASLILLSQTHLLQASPLGIAHSSEEYAVSTESLRRWSCGVLYEQSDRELEGTDATFTHQMVYLGYDVARFVRVYGGLGTVDSKFGAVTADNNRGRFTIGARFNLLDQEIMDPTLMEDRIGLTASLDYTSEEVAYPTRSEDTDLTEVSAALLLSIMNEIDTTKEYAPESVTVFIGPLFSDFDSDYKALNEKDNVGYCAGLDIHYTQSVSMTLSFEQFEDLGVNAGLHLAF